MGLSPYPVAGCRTISAGHARPALPKTPWNGIPAVREVGRRMEFRFTARVEKRRLKRTKEADLLKETRGLSPMVAQATVGLLRSLRPKEGFFP